MAIRSFCFHSSLSSAPRMLDKDKKFAHHETHIRWQMSVTITKAISAMRNLELKARLNDFAAAREMALSLSTDYVGIQIQTDTYFNSPQGRLKLREIENLASQLIWYDRPDEANLKTSNYFLVPTDSPEDMKSLLAAACGIHVTVKKRREIFMVRNVRIHLDQVEGLGDFLEFEAVLSPETDEETSRTLLDFLREKFVITDDSLLPGSYGELHA
jgi:adenylate cyclase, class 2